MKRLFSPVAVFAFCTVVAGCAAPGGSRDTNAGSAPVSASMARQALTAGKSTRDDVIAALGKTTVVNFDSGFEVWVYRIKDDPAERADRPGAEFVVLIAPDDFTL